MSTAALQLVDVHKSFGITHIIRGVNLAVPSVTVTESEHASGQSRVHVVERTRVPATVVMTEA